MTNDPTNDILAEIAKDPKKLLAVLQQMDGDNDKHVTAKELIAWVSKNVKNLHYLQPNDATGVPTLVDLGADFKNLGESALTAPGLEETYSARKYGSDGKPLDNSKKPEMTPEIREQLVAANKNFERLQNELHGVAEKFQNATANNVSAAEQQGRPPTEQEIKDEKDFQDDIKERREGAAVLRKTGNAKMADDIEKSIAEDEATHRKELADKGILNELADVKATRAQVAKYTIDDAGEADLGQLTTVVKAAGGKVPVTKGRQ